VFLTVQRWRLCGRQALQEQPNALDPHPETLPRLEAAHAPLQHWVGLGRALHGARVPLPGHPRRTRPGAGGGVGQGVVLALEDQLQDSKKSA